MNLKLKRTPGIYVVGFMAAGKSTVGRHLAHRLGWNFFDTDHEIELAEKATIADLFTSRGEAEFRAIETRMIRQHLAWIERGRPAVLALGGGAYAEAINRQILNDNGLTVWLDCPLEIVKRRIEGTGHRPLAQDPERFVSLYESRRAAYSSAEIHIAIESDDPEVTVNAIVHHPVFR
jgi:shikimate kinase